MTAYYLSNRRANLLNTWNPSQAEDLVLYGAFGVIFGGRVGYMLFYQFSNFISDPLSIFSIQGGGMSFHGGLVGVLIAVLIFNKRHNKSFFETTDFVVPLVPLGLGFGRVGNFINGELWGKITTSDFGMYIQSQGVSRYPSQLYEAILEGLVLFIILWIYSNKPRPKGHTTSLFLILYSLFRFIVEFVREPDPHLGYIAFDWLTMGQILCIPMFILGLILLYINKKVV